MLSKEMRIDHLRTRTAAALKKTRTIRRKLRKGVDKKGLRQSKKRVQ